MEPQIETSVKLVNVSKDVDWLSRDIKRFYDIGYLIPKIQVRLYKAISKYVVGGRTVLDFGCSIGLGSNILSHEARFVWGLDVNEQAIRFAKNMFKRPNLDFEIFDLENPTLREFAKFEIVTMIEVLEHLVNPDASLKVLKQKFFNENTIGFITVPNINNEKVKLADANNPLHLTHWTAGEFYSFLITHFKSVTLYGSEHLNCWNQSETVDGNSKDRVIIAKVQGLL